MAAATNQQVQDHCDQRVRPRCAAAYLLYLQCKNDQANMDDVYANLTSSPTWTDGRSAGVAHLATPNDLLAINTWRADFITFYEANSQKAILEKLPINPIPN